MEIKEGHIILTKQEHEQLLQTIATLEATIKVQQENINKQQETINKQQETINKQQEIIEKQEIRIRELEFKIKELEGRLHQNSSNSHKPPSSDGLKKVIKNNRVPTNRKSGGQKGHEGKTLKMVEHPDKIIFHSVKGVCDCGKDLEEAEVLRIERRQVFDLPKKLCEVTEHQIEVKRCECGRIHRGECELKGNTQYGDKVKGLVVYLIQQKLSYKRVQQFMEDVFGLPLGGGTIEAANKECYERLEESERQIKEGLLGSKVIHCDETGIRCANKTQWIHVTCNERFTYYFLHSKRGKEAMDEIGILPRYKGNCVHDRWSSYERYECEHSYCNVHLLRELRFVEEEMGRRWAEEMKRVLLLGWYMKKRNWLSGKAIDSLMRRYEKVVEKGIEEERRYDSAIEGIKKRGRKKKGKSVRLLEVFIRDREKVMRFIHNKDTPFDNNIAERDLRMVKLKQKVSGCFRTVQGGKIFCRIRSYISSVRKQGYSVLDSIVKALKGKPVTLFQPC
jgi:transposase